MVYLWAHAGLTLLPAFSYRPLAETPLPSAPQAAHRGDAHRSPDMIDLKNLDDLARKLSDLVPPGLKDARADLEQNFKATLQAGLGKLDLVTREEFEVQRAVLLRTREKLDAMERAITVLEARLAEPGASKN